MVSITEYMTIKHKFEFDYQNIILEKTSMKPTSIHFKLTDS